MQLVISPLVRAAGDLLELEIVERKGTGHPDTISDEIAEEFSLALSRYYVAEFGQVLHHNVDKVLLVAGESRPAFGGGEIVTPIRLFLAGRATQTVGGRPVPVEALACDATHGWLGRHLPVLDLRHVELHTLVHPGSADLGNLFGRGSAAGRWLANDTSCGVGHAPLSRLESIVDAVERTLGALAVAGELSAVGRDIKVMGLRRGRQIHLTIACAMIGRALRHAADYLGVKEEVARVARRTAEARGAENVAVDVNAADDPASGSFYLTVSGTSAEAGDDGQAGRGNRANGLIAPYRPTTMESVAGKNPVTHVGKIYNIAAGLMAEAITTALPDVASAEVSLVSQIGRPVSEPLIVNVRVATADDRATASLTREIEAIVESHLRRIDTLWQDLLAGTVRFGRWPLRQA